jgi:hypothetical protein
MGVDALEFIRKDCVSLQSKEPNVLNPKSDRMQSIASRIDRVRRRIAAVAGTGICVFIVAERMHSYAIALDESAQASGTIEIPAAEGSKAVDAPAGGEDRFEFTQGNQREPIDAKPLSNEELQPLGETDKRQYEGIKTRAQACKQFDGRLIAFYDQTALIQKCKARLIEDPLLLNVVRKQNQGRIQDVPASVYRLFAQGEPIRESDINGIEKALGLTDIKDICATLNGQYVTATGTNFYYVENCKKRLFLVYAGLEEHNRSKRTILTVTPGQLARLANGKDMPERGEDVSDVWIKIDGDASWQRTSRIDESSTGNLDSPEKLREIAKQQQRPVNVPLFCKQHAGKIVSFYADLYLVEDCRLRLIKDQSLQLQIKIDGRTIVQDLSSNEKRSLKMGKPISSDEVMARLMGNKVQQ